MKDINSGPALNQGPLLGQVMKASAYRRDDKMPLEAGLFPSGPEASVNLIEIKC